MDEKIYQTYQIQIKKGHRLYVYCQSMCQNAKNLYNTTNFYIRQVYTAMTTTKTLHPLQKEVIETVQAGIQVILTEESYTSKASFLDHDILPIPSKIFSTVFASFLVNLYDHLSGRPSRKSNQLKEPISSNTLYYWKKSNINLFNFDLSNTQSICFLVF